MPNSAELPKQAKKVFKGVIFDTYQWKQKMFDGSTRTFEKVRRQDTAVIIATVGKRLVILKQQQPGSDWYYDLPSGRMDKAGESPKKAAARELLEETGLKAKELVLWKTYHPSGKVVQNVFFFIARDCKQVAPQQLDGGEKIEISTASFDEFLALSDHPKCFYGPLMIDVLLARLHKECYEYLKTSIFGSWTKVPKPPKFGPKINW
jgi:ADP-ribose pyrophosphatase